LCILVNIASQTNGSVAVSEADIARSVAANSVVRADHQSQDREGARPYYANRSACARQRGDRM